MKKSLIKAERLRGRYEIIHLLKSAKKTRSGGLTLLFNENGGKSNRIAFFMKKGFKNAVKRNRHKRILKEIYREYKHVLKQGFDLIFLLSSGEYTYVQLKECVLRLFERSGMLVMKREG